VTNEVIAGGQAAGATRRANEGIVFLKQFTKAEIEPPLDLLMPTECSQDTFAFGTVGSLVVAGASDGDEITSDELRAIEIAAMQQAFECDGY